MNTILLLDTEFLNFSQPLIYDLSYTIATFESNQYEPSKIIANVIKEIYNNKLLFNTAYYKNKKPLYTSALRRKTYTKKSFYMTMKTLKKDIQKYNVKYILGYNINADIKALENTCQALKVNTPFNDNVVIIDLMPIVIKTICDTDEYKTFANNHKLITIKGYYKVSVEAVAKYIYNNPNFIEKHIALSDNRHELNLLNEVIKNNGTIKKEKLKFLRAT
jgi:hypothetical protein